MKSTHSCFGLLFYYRISPAYGKRSGLHVAHFFILDPQRLALADAAGTEPGLIRSMDKSEIMAKLSRIGGRVLGGLELEMVGIDLERQRGGWFLRLFIDKPGGVTLEDCQAASKQLGAELDVEDVILDRYTLEVSSPGLDRPLRTEEDYHRFVGRLATVHTFEPIQGRRNFVGLLRSLHEGVVTIVDAEGRRWKIPKSNISRARLEIEF